MPTIGFLAGGLQQSGLPMVAAYKQGLADTGYVEGENVDRIPLGECSI
jgi:hypothetical protein